MPLLLIYEHIYELLLVIIETDAALCTTILWNFFTVAFRKIVVTVKNLLNKHIYIKFILEIIFGLTHHHNPAQTTTQ